ncbi:MAG: hypothetical protein KAT70_08390, partial [Thermoplasmata archaeon]|nr:hypothetical protein [Thermoplasmata archaeon]
MRKSPIISVVLVTALAMQMIAVFPVVTEAQTATSEETTLYIAMQEDMPNFNNWDLASNSVWKDYVIGKWCFEGLSGLDPAGNIFPSLAENWTFDEDTLTVNVALRQGVLFHDGEEMTADDVVFTFNALRDGATYSSNIIDAFDSDDDGKASEAEIATGVTKVDDYNVKFVMGKSYGQFFLMTLGVPIIPEHIWSSHLSDGVVDTLWGDDSDATIGTGPFYYAGGEKDVYRDLRIFDDYWGKDEVTPSGHALYPAEITRIYFKLYSSLDTAILALKSGQVDHIPWTLTTGYVSDLLSNPTTEVQSISDN